MSDTRRCPHDYAYTDGTVADWCPACEAEPDDIAWYDANGMWSQDGDFVRNDDRVDAYANWPVGAGQERNNQ